MPENYLWKRLGDIILFKCQDYQYSCFSACLQIILANFDLIKVRINAPDRPIENNFNDFKISEKMGNLDASPPTIETTLSFLKSRYFHQKNDVCIVFIDELNKSEISKIKKQIKKNKIIALIGAIKGDGHATAIIKLGKEMYAINPSRDDSFNEIGKLDTVSDGKTYALSAKDRKKNSLGAMEYLYVITKK